MVDYARADANEVPREGRAGNAQALGGVRDGTPGSNPMPKFAHIGFRHMAQFTSPPISRSVTGAIRMVRSCFPFLFS